MTSDWARHLSPEEVREFAVDLVDAVRNGAGPDVHANLYRVIAEWRATAGILADPELAAELTRPLPGDDHGEVPERGDDVPPPVARAARRRPPRPGAPGAASRTSGPSG
ncbi:hypothetical protein [Streptomyces pyridomyceticus]|uniref:hypothetical protein n=1 Tax=Streptomyces pyridomyceticus TaxID=68260 RepID=UPI001F394397|nr:hypothetical protein [Streptomyces pyridomyceticus]